jgi:hypothetical protein
MCRKLVYLMAFVLLLGMVGSVWADDMVAHWKFLEGTDPDTTVYDSTSYGNDGTMYNMSYGEDWVSWDCAELGGWLDFNGTDEYIRVPDDASIEFGVGSFSIAFWMFTPSGTGGEILVNGTSFEPAYSGKRYEILLSSGQMYFVIDSGGPTGKLYLNTSIAGLVGGWHHVVCYRNIETGKLYIYFDGVRKAYNVSSTNYSDINSPNEDLYIARGGIDMAYSWFPGKLRDIRFYNYVLSDEKIAAMADENYNDTLLTWCPDPADGAEHIALNTDFSWNTPSDANDSGNEAWKYKVYLSTDSALPGDPVIINSVQGQDRLTATNVQMNGPLAVATYYWRVDSYEPNEGPVVTRTGAVWSFTSGAVAPTLISPANGSTNEINVNLVWSSDPLVAHSRVHVKVGGVWQNLGVHTSPFNLYTYGLTDSPDLITMAWATNYPWKIEELNAGNSTLVWGDEWNFNVRTLNCDDPEPLAADLTHNCVVDIADFAILASEWLTCNWNDNEMAKPACP